MKKLTLLLLAALSGLTASAQTEKGTHMLGGSFSLNHNKSEPANTPSAEATNKQNAFSIGPSYTYFLANKLGLTANLGYSRSHSDQYATSGSTETTNTGLFASLSLNKYFLFEDKIGVRTGPFTSYNTQKAKATSTYDYNGGDFDFKGYSAGLNLEFVYFPVKRIGLVASLGSLAYSRTEFKRSTGATKQTDLSLGFLNNTTSFSFYYVLGK
ncbi:outer membrane beta-barrel protein [Pedobacter sp. SAFR-022]|uniref:outer membrane beta-barrel protein n=1 Tax=Pedobacter sp. SAFR-022 TaxID=3436861 RepID=UPI003F80DB4D